MKKLLILPVLLFCLVTLLTFPVLADQQSLSVSALIGPQPPDFQFSLAPQNGDTTVHNGQSYTYVITYGAKAKAALPTDNTIVFDWSQALLPNNQTMFDYIYGSASDGYNHAKPVVDTTNKTITWTIPNFPAGTTDQTLTFSLFTNTYDKSTTSFPFHLLATMNNQYVSMPQEDLLEYYHYQTPPPGPTATPGPQPTGTPTPTPTPPGYNVDISNISPTNATIQVATNNPTKLTVNYGTSPGNLNQSISTNSYLYQSSLSLQNLQLDTQYYFRIILTAKDGSTYTTELYTFKTAAQSLSALPLAGTAVVSSNGSVLLSVAYNQTMSPGFAILTSPFPYDVTVSLDPTSGITSLESIVQQDRPIDTMNMKQQPAGIYTAHMPNLNSGLYSLVIKSLDQEGMLISQKIVDLKVIPPLSVSDKQSGSALDNARVELFTYDAVSQSYKPLLTDYTNANGNYVINLPPGKYEAKASALFYDSATVEFTLGKNDRENFPHIQLRKNPTNIMAMLNFIQHYVNDILTSAFTALQTIATSSWAFHIAATATTGFLILLSYLLFLLKSHTSLKHLPLFLLIFIDVLLNKHKGKYLFGKVTDANGAPLSLVRVEVEDAQTKTILRHTTTNKTGKFYFMNKFPSSVNLIFIKEGFQPESRVLPQNGFPENGLQIMLDRGTPHHTSAIVVLGRGFKDLLGMLFETALVLSIILEILFCIFYGWEKTLPFLILSILNILLWLFYLNQKSGKSLI